MTTIGSSRPASPKWSKKETWRLLAAVRKFGPEWGRVASIFPGRSRSACQHRFFKQAPPALKRRYGFNRAPDLTPEQIEQAKYLRATGNKNGNLDWGTVAKQMGIQRVQLDRVFRPQEIERKKAIPLQLYGFLDPDRIDVPAHVWAERELALSVDRFSAASLLGDPPFHRSALYQKLNALRSEHEAR